MSHQIKNQPEAGRLLEGGIFYPTGHIVAAFPEPETAASVRRKLEDMGFAGVLHIPAARMALEARTNIDNVTSMLSFGASVPVREKQLQLAEEGCDFIVVHAPHEEDEQRVLEVLAAVNLRYVVKYKTLIIENLIPQIPGREEKQPPGEHAQERDEESSEKSSEAARVP